MLKTNGYDYLCVSRSNVKNYYADTDSKSVVIKDKREQPIELRRVKIDNENNTDNFLWVKSKVKALKENSMNGNDPDKKAGIYFLRTTLDVENEKTFWDIYNIIRDIEYTFRVLKTDLDLRPIYHKSDDASMAHLNLGLMAYWLVSTILYQLNQQ